MNRHEGDRIEADMSSNGTASASPALRGTISQIAWAERIRQSVAKEFDCVAACFHAVAIKQDSAKRADTMAIISILEEKRFEVLSRDQAGYFIRNWQEIGDQVRQLILRDLRYHALRAGGVSRRQSGAL